MRVKIQNWQLMAGGLVLLLVLAGGGFLAYKKFMSKPATTAAPTTRKRISEPVNQIEVSERPYIQIAPLSDGKNLELIVKSVKKNATEMEYELEYQAGTLLQGAFGSIPLSGGAGSMKILLGSCSAGGACTYHTDVKGGTLLTKFKGETNYALKSDWRYFDNKARETQISSKDAKFQLASPDLKDQRYMIVFNTAGFPRQLPGKLVSEIYSLAVSSALKGTGELTMRASEEGTLTIMGYDGQAWKSFDTKTDGKQATAKVDLLELYVVVKK